MIADAQTTTSKADVDCYAAADSAKHVLPGGTRVFVRTQIVLTQRSGQSEKIHDVVDSGAIKGTIGSGAMEFDSRKVALDAGVPIRFSIGQEICAVPAASTIPSFLKDTRFYIAP
jgi:hypothetical protein